MSDPYTPDKVRGLLKMATWYSAVKLVEEDVVVSHADLNRVLDLYAGRFRRLARDAKADRLSELATAMRRARPDDYAEDGSCDWSTAGGS